MTCDSRSLWGMGQRALITILAVFLLAWAGIAQGAEPWVLRLAVLSDMHVSDEPDHAPYLAHYRQAIQQVNEANVDAVLVAGDLSESGQRKQLQDAKGMAAGLRAPFYMVAGNHDVGGIATPGKSGPSQKRLDLFTETIGPHFYTADLSHGMKLVAIDASLFGSNTALEKQQWQLLERELGPGMPARSRVLLMHYPPFVESADEADGYMSLNRAERQRLLQLLEGGKAVVVVTGHQHRPRDVTYKGLRIITAPPVSFGLPRDRQAPGWMLIEISQDASIRTRIRELSDSEMAAPSTPSIPSTRVHIFYYPWYGAAPLEKTYIHWTQRGHTPPDDIASDFYPALGPYSSADPRVLQQHMKWIRQAHIGVIVISWWGKGSFEDQRVGAILDAAAAEGLKAAFHLEPYDAQTPESLANDIRYILGRYGSHRAFYRDAAQGGKPVFYSFQTLRHPARQWSDAIQRLRADVEPVLILAQTSDLGFIRSAGFDGGYPYDVLAPFKDPSFLRGWNDRIALDFRAAGKLFVPSVGPGYTDGRAVPNSAIPASARTRDDGKATTYDAAWRAAIQTDAPFISVTSFNEWHEGSQIEPAVAKEIPGYRYPAYAQGEMQYIARTAYWVDQFSKQSATRPSAAASAARRSYLKPSGINVKKVLPAPPAEDSDRQKEEIEQLLRLQAGRDAAQVKQCKADEAFIPFTFAEVLGSWFNPDDLPFTAQFLNQVLYDVNHVSESAKRVYNRRRPFLVDPRIQPCIGRPNSMSYPSGHAARGAGLAYVLCEMFPEKADEITAVGKRIGDSRVLGGVHFPSDVEAGRVIARAVFDEIRDEPAFRADLAKARSECLAKSKGSKALRAKPQTVSP